MGTRLTKRVSVQVFPADSAGKIRCSAELFNIEATADTREAALSQITSDLRSLVEAKNKKAHKNRVGSITRVQGDEVVELDVFYVQES